MHDKLPKRKLVNNLATSVLHAKIPIISINHSGQWTSSTIFFNNLVFKRTHPFSILSYAGRMKNYTIHTECKCASILLGMMPRNEELEEEERILWGLMAYLYESCICISEIAQLINNVNGDMALCKLRYYCCLITMIPIGTVTPPLQSIRIKNLYES